MAKMSDAQAPLSPIPMPQAGFVSQAGAPNGMVSPYSHISQVSQAPAIPAPVATQGIAAHLSQAVQPNGLDFGINHSGQLSQATAIPAAQTGFGYGQQISQGIASGQQMTPIPVFPAVKR